MDWGAIAREFAAPARPEPMLEFYQVASALEGSALERGHRIVDAIRRDLAAFDTDTRRRSPAQVQMHERFLRACGQRVYGEAFNTHQIEIMEYNHWEDTLPYVAVQAPRRFGKSLGTALFAAAFALNMPGACRRLPR